MFGRRRRVTTSTSDDHPRSKSRSRRARIILSYAPDWALTIFLWGIFYLLDKIDGYRRLFSVTDTSLAHPYAQHERVPVWLLAVICAIVPGVLMILYALVISRSFWDAHSSILGLILCLGLIVTFTDIVKITVGRPRPDLFSRCQLPADLTADPTHGLTSWTACTQTDKLKDGFRSFPSGHSSFAWGGMWYFTLWAGGKLHVLNNLGYTYKSWLLLAPIACAALVAISRTMDYRHHATDVIAGSIIGVIGAWWGYRQYFPPVASPLSHKPHSPRIPHEDIIPLHHTRSERSEDRERRQADRLHPFANADGTASLGVDSSNGTPGVPGRQAKYSIPNQGAGSISTSAPTPTEADHDERAPLR